LTEYFKIGKLVAASGLKGEMILKHTLGRKTSLKGLQAVFVEDRKDSFIPWFIQNARIKNDDEVYLKLEGVDSRESASRIAQKEVWITETDFKKFAARTAPISLLGYTIFNYAEPLGEILEVIEQPHQVLCRLEIKGNEVLIPLNESFLKKIRHAKKQVMVELPDGLLEIYL
jgi:16S rRNA processing protein RimM